jgi:hypothetical protein
LHQDLYMFANFINLQMSGPLDVSWLS